MQQPLSQQAACVHAFLFTEGGTLSIKRLAQLIGANEDQMRAAIRELASALAGSGLCVVETDHEVALATAPETAKTVKAAFEAQLQRDIGDAGLEVLSILLYRGPSTRAEIDYIRGVNTGSTVRALLARGLIARSPGLEGGREYLYRPTPEILAHLGVRNAEELSEYATIHTELAAFEQLRSPFEEHADGADAITTDRTTSA